jgi:ADP-ribosyl-[dinitrogen reductase] hydrolase
MDGAFIGDIEGSVFEFHNTHDLNFDLFAKDLAFTDDSVMTLAVADICHRKAYHDPNKIRSILREWGRAYPYAGYGSLFDQWLYQEDDRSNPSYGNGAAMRISPVGYYAHNEEEVKRWSKAITLVSHNHPEAVKGAEVTAMCIFYALHGKDKAFISSYARKAYQLYPSYEAICESNHGHGLEICQISVPQAISAFLLSNDFESCLRMIIAAGGDCDTTGAIACSIAEAYYKEIDPKLIAFSRGILSSGGEKIRTMLQTIDQDLSAASSRGNQ